MALQLNDTLISELPIEDVMGYFGMTWINLQNLTDCNSEMEIKLSLGERFLVLNPTMSRSILDGPLNYLRVERASKLQGDTGDR